MNIYTRYRASSIIYDLVKGSPGGWIIPDNVCHAILASVIAGGGQPIITDVDAFTLELDEFQVLDKMKKHPNIQGIIIVRTYGNTSQNYTSFIREVRNINENIVIIDDRCLAIPETIAPIKENGADVYLYSTGYSKFVDLGYGSHAFSKHPIFSSQRIHNEDDETSLNEFFKQAISYNGCVPFSKIEQMSKSGWLNTNIIEKKKYINKVEIAKQESTIRKKELNRIYSSIREELILGEYFNDWRFTLKVTNREEVLNRIFENNLFASKHYYPLSQIMGRKESTVWSGIFYTIINLFNDFRYTPDMAEKTVAIVNKYATPIAE